MRQIGQRGIDSRPIQFQCGVAHAVHVPLLVLLGVVMWLVAASASAATILKDPQGFNGIPWGAALAESADLELVEPGNLIKGYNVKRAPLQFGDVPVDSIRYVTIDGKFARVVIRYRGRDTHERIVAYLVSHLGPIEQSQILRDVSQPLNWRGLDTEVNVTFQQMSQRGLIFFESRALAPKFQESMGDTIN